MNSKALKTMSKLQNQNTDIRLISSKNHFKNARNKKKTAPNNLTNRDKSTRMKDRS
jgi:hypothetical protein